MRLRKGKVEEWGEEILSRMWGRLKQTRTVEIRTTASPRAGTYRDYHMLGSYLKAQSFVRGWKPSRSSRCRPSHRLNRPLALVSDAEVRRRCSCVHLFCWTAIARVYISRFRRGVCNLLRVCDSAKFMVEWWLRDATLSTRLEGQRASLLNLHETGIIAAHVIVDCLRIASSTLK